MAGEGKSDFISEREKAVERMREMSRRSQISSQPHKMPPTPPFVKLTDSRGNDNYEGVKNNSDSLNSFPKEPPSGGKPSGFGNLNGGIASILGKIGVPVSGGWNGDSDMTLILGILLILSSEKADRFLLLALLYILI